MGVTLLFYVPLPWALISECQPHDRAIEASLSLHRFPFSLPLYPPSPCRWRSSGQLLLLNPCFPSKSLVGFQRQSSSGQRKTVKPLVPLSSSILSSPPCSLIISAGKEMNIYWMPPRYQPLLEALCISVNPYKPLPSPDKWTDCTRSPGARVFASLCAVLPSSRNALSVCLPEANLGTSESSFSFSHYMKWNSFLSPICFTLVKVLGVVSLSHDSALTASRLFSVSAVFWWWPPPWASSHYCPLSWSSRLLG